MRTIPINPDSAAELVASERWALRVVDGPDGCRLWTGRDNGAGYGRIRIDGVNRFVHRIAYVAATGADIPAGMSLDHLCMTRACVNPTHLEAVTLRENTTRGHLWSLRVDAHRAGRSPMYDMAGAADYLGTSHRHMQRLWADRRVAGVKIGGRVRFTQADLDAYIAAHRVEAVAR